MRSGSEGGGKNPKRLFACIRLYFVQTINQRKIDINSNKSGERRKNEIPKLLVANTTHKPCFAVQKCPAQLHFDCFICTLHMLNFEKSYCSKFPIIIGKFIYAGLEMFEIAQIGFHQVRMLASNHSCTHSLTHPIPFLSLLLSRNSLIHSVSQSFIAYN